jgi:hypothetical protein
MNNNTSHTSSSFETAPSPVIMENPNAVLTPPDSIQLSKTRTFYAEVAEPLKSVYGMILSSECPSVDEYQSLSKEAQNRLKAYVPVDLAIAKFKVDPNFSKRDENGRTEQKINNASAHLQQHSLLHPIEVTEELVIQFHDFTERTLQEQIKSVINQIIRYTFNEYVTKRTTLTQHDGVRLLSYNDVVGYVGHRLMPPGLSGKITKVWTNLYKRGEERRVLTQSIVDLFNLRFHVSSSTRSSRGHILDHNFICYYINEVINNLKAPMLKKNRAPELRSVSVTTKRKHSGGLLDTGMDTSNKASRGDAPAVHHHHPHHQHLSSAVPPHVPVPFGTLPGSVLGAPYAGSFPGVVNPAPMLINHPSAQQMMDPQQMFNLMSMFVPQFQQNYHAAMNRHNMSMANPPGLATGGVAPDSFSMYIDSRLHPSPVCHGTNGNRLHLDRHALLNEELPDEENNGMLSLSYDEEEDDVELTNQSTRARTSPTSPYELNLPGTENHKSTAGEYRPFGSSVNGLAPGRSHHGPPHAPTAAGHGGFAKRLQVAHQKDNIPPQEKVQEEEKHPEPKENELELELEHNHAEDPATSDEEEVVQEEAPKEKEHHAEDPATSDEEEVVQEEAPKEKEHLQQTSLNPEQEEVKQNVADTMADNPEPAENPEQADTSDVDTIEADTMADNPEQADTSDVDPGCVPEEFFLLWAGGKGCSPHGSSFLRLAKIKSFTDKGIIVAGSSSNYNCCNPTCRKEFNPTYCCVKHPSKPHSVMFCGHCVETAQKRMCGVHTSVTPSTIYGDPKKYMAVYAEGNHMFGNSKWGRGKTCNGCNTTDYKRACKTSSNAFFYCKQCRDDYIKWQETSDDDDLNAPYVCLFCVDCKEHAVLRNVQMDTNTAVNNSTLGLTTRRRVSRKLPLNKGRN